MTHIQFSLAKNNIPQYENKLSLKNIIANAIPTIYTYSLFQQILKALHILSLWAYGHRFKPENNLKSDLTC